MTMTIKIALKLVCVIQCAVLKIKMDQLQANLKSISFQKTFIKVRFK